MAKIWTNINDWIREMNAQNGLFDESHLTSRLEGMDKTLKQIDAYKSLVQAGRGGFGGKEGHRLSTSLSNFQSLARENGFGIVQIVQEGERTYRINFLPTYDADKISVDECPALIISDTNEYGLTVQNQLPSINAMMIVRKDSGEIGFASAAAVGIDEAANAFRRVANGVGYKTMSLKDQARALKNAIRTNANEVIKNNPMASSRHQKDSFREALSLDPLSEIRSEQAKLMSGQVYTGYYYQSLLNAKKDQIYGYDERLEKQIYRELANFEHHSKNFTDAESLGEYLRNSKNLFPLINKYLWEGELQNLYKGLYSVGLTFGGKTEGTPGIFSLFNPLIPGHSILPKASRKASQNLRILQKGFKEGVTKGFAPNLVHLKNEFTDEEFASGDAFKNLYVTAEITEKNIDQGIEEYLYSLIGQAQEAASKGLNSGVKINLTNLYKGKLVDSEGKKIEVAPVVDMLKGVTADAELIANQIVEDFNIAVKKQEKIHRFKVTSELDKIAKKYLSAIEYEAFKVLSPEQQFEVFKTGEYTLEVPGEEKDTSTIVKQKFKSKRKKFAAEREKALNRAVLSALGLDPDDSNNYVESVEYNKELDSYIANIKHTFGTKTATVRGGSTTDDRAVASNINDDLLGYILKAAGYTEQEIRDESGRLKITHARLARGFENKTAHSDFMGITEYIIGSLYNRSTAKEKKDKLQEVVNEFDKTAFKGLLKVDSKGGFEWDEEVLKKLLEERKKEGTGIAGLIRDIGNLGARLGIYKDRKGKKFTGDIFTIEKVKNADGTIEQVLKLDEQAKFITAQELGIASGNRNQGLNYKNSAGEESGMKIDRRVVDNLYNTAGKMLASGSQFATEAALMQAQADRYNRELTKIEAGFKPYERNLNFLTNRGPGGTSSFAPNQEEAYQKLIQAGGIVLSYEDFIGAKDLKDYEYGKLEGDFQQSFQGYIQARQQKQYEALKKKYKDLAIKNSQEKLTDKEAEEAAEEELRQQGINNASDIQVALQSSRDIRYNYGTNTGKLIFLGRGNIKEADTDDSNEKFSEMDEIAVYNTRMVRDFLKFERGALTLSAFGKKVHDYTEDVVDSLSKNGSIWDKYHSFKDTNGGQFLLQGMSTGIQDRIKDLQKKGIISVDASGDKDNKPHISGIMNASEYEEMLADAIFNALKDKDKEENAKEIKAYDAFYEEITGEKIRGSFAEVTKETVKNRIKKIREALSIDDPYKYKGKTARNIGLNRAPIIKGVNDVIKTGFVLSDFVERGNIMVDPGTAAIMKGDFDGDRIALTMFKAAITGDNRYFDWMSDEQRKPLEKKLKEAQKQAKQKSGTVDKINVSDAVELAKFASTHSGKKGSGIYGDLTIGWQNAMRKFGLDWGAVTSEVEHVAGPWLNSNASQLVTPAKAQELFGHIVGSLYQNAINIKNLKESSVEELQKKYPGINIYPDAQATLDNLVKNKNSWDNEKELSDMIGLMQEMSLISPDAENIFKENILGELGLNLKTVPENIKYALAELYYIDEDDLEKREKYIQKFVKNFNKNKDTIFSRDYLVKVGKYLNATLHNKTGKTVGDIFSNIYKYIPGHENNLYNVFGDRTEEQIAIETDPQGIQRLKEAGLYRGTDAQGKVIVGRELEGWAKWEEDVDSRLSNRLAKLKARNFETEYETGKKLDIIGGDANNILSSSTTRVRNLLKRDKEGSNQVFPKAQKFIEDVTLGKDASGFEQQLGLWKNSYQEEFNTLKAIFTGNLVHRMAEVATDALQKGNVTEITEDKLTELLDKDPEYQKIYGQLGTLYKFKYGDKNTNFGNEALKKAVNVGYNQLVLLENQLAEERRIGAEMSLFTYTGETGRRNSLISGVADLITARGKIGGEGEDQHILTVTDYKNYARGELSPDVVLQTLQYVDSLRLLHTELKERFKGQDVSKWNTAKIKEEADKFLAEDNGLSQVWRAIINDKLATRNWKNRLESDDPAKESEIYSADMYQMFVNLFGELIDPNLRFKIRANIANTNNASVHSFEAFADSAKGNLITKVLLGANQGIFEGFTKAQIDDITSIMTKTDSLIIDRDQEENANHFIADTRKLMQQHSEIARLQRLLRRAEEKEDFSGIAALERQIAEKTEKYKNNNETFDAVLESWGKADGASKRAILVGYGLQEKLGTEDLTDEELSDTTKLDPMQVIAAMEQQNTELSRKQEETGEVNINKWKQVSDNIKKYEQLKTILEAKLGNPDTVDSAKAIFDSQLKDINDVLYSLNRQKSILETGFLKRDSFGDILDPDEYTEEFEEAKRRQRIADRQEKITTEQEALAQYEASINKRKELEDNKIYVQSLLKDSEYMASLSAQDQEQLRNKLKEIDKAITKYTDSVIENEAIILASTNPDIQAQQKEIRKKLGKSYVSQEVRDVDLKIATLTKRQQDYHAAVQDYAALENAKRQVSMIDQKIARSINDDQRTILELEKQSALERQAAAQAVVDRRQKMAEGEQDLVNKVYQLKVNKRASEEARLRMLVQERADKEQTRGTGILGIADKGLGQLLGRFIGGQALYRLLGKFKQTLSQLTNEAKALDKALTNLRIVTGDTKDNTRGLITQYSNLAQALGVTTKAVATSAVEWLRQGYSTSEAMDLIKSSMYLSTLGMIDSAQATKSLYSRLLM